MTEINREALLGVVRTVWSQRDPVPDGLVSRMQAVVAAEASVDFDLDYELLVLIERSYELTGARGGGSAYTLQFAHGDMALLVRAAGEEQPGDGGRLDGWLAPAAEMTIKASLVTEDGEWVTDIDARGRFEFRNLPSGLFRLWLTPREAGAKPFGTPAFEL
ncbi:conserved hypothetical protein [metagenome]|uniref:Carboxypeptidase regulatory-like domain-containing protein n=1 Tax=metagenome TaxID=256318 RepID=A0A2P2BZ47_9ZZZZ